MNTHKINFSQSRMQGFTLIEIMIVLAIIAILVSIAWPLYHNQSLKSQRGEAVSMISLLRMEMERCASNNNGLYAANCPAIATGFVLPVIAAKYDPSGTRGAIYVINAGDFSLTGVDANGDGTGYTLIVTNVVGNDNDCVSFTTDNLGNKGFTEVAGSQSSVIRCLGSN